MKLVYQYVAIFFNFSPITSNLLLLQVENCDSNSRLVVEENDNGKIRLERVKKSFLEGSHLSLCKGTDATQGDEELLFTGLIGGKCRHIALK